MKKIFSVTPYTETTNLAILLARTGIAALMLTHGLPKMMSLFGSGPVQFPSVFGMAPEMSLALAVFAEVLCSILLLTGLATRLATIPLIITMAVAAFSIHAADPFARQEPALQYMLVYLVLLLTGAGKYSLDYLLQTRVQKAGRRIEDPTLSIYQQ